MPAGENNITIALGGILPQKAEVKVAIRSCAVEKAVMAGKNEIMAQQVT